MFASNQFVRTSVLEDPEVNTVKQEEITQDECLGNKSKEAGVVIEVITPEDIHDSAHRSNDNWSTMAAVTMWDFLARAIPKILFGCLVVFGLLIRTTCYLCSEFKRRYKEEEEDYEQEESMMPFLDTLEPKEIAQYDIFLSFRGLDTRKKFAAHLYKELKREGFKAFRDDKNMLWGKVINFELHRAISNSRTSVVILSENFANSTACLFEIQTMLEQCKQSNHLILPVFYEIQPEQIKEQAKNLNFENEKVSVEEQTRWSAALEEVANMSGVASQNYSSEPELIENIIHKLRSRLDDESLRVADGHLVSAAIKIQQMYRGWKGRKKFLKMRKLAVKIQAYYRGHQARLSEARDNRDHNTLL